MRALRFRLAATIVALLATLICTTDANAAIGNDGSTGWATVAEGTGYTYYVPLAPLFTTSLVTSGYGWVPTSQANPKFVAMMTGPKTNYIYVADICKSGFVWVWFENQWWTGYATHFNLVAGYSTPGNAPC